MIPKNILFRGASKNISKLSCARNKTSTSISSKCTSRHIQSHSHKAYYGTQLEAYYPQTYTPISSGFYGGIDHFEVHKNANTIASISRGMTTGTRTPTTSNLSTKQLTEQYLKQLSPREEGNLEQELLRAISEKSLDPVLKSDIRKLGWLQSLKINTNSSSMILSEENEHGDGDGDESYHPISIELNLPTLLHPNLQEMVDNLKKVVSNQILEFMEKKGILDKSQVKDSLNEDSKSNSNTNTNALEIEVIVNCSKPSPFVRNVEEQDDLIKKLGPGLSNVRHFLAVYSCKGGVGKSTVATNLAYDLARLGGRVGLLDVDVYGPSLPVLVKPDDPAIHPSTIGPGVVKPIEHKGVKMISLGFVSPTSGVPGSGPNAGAAVMRGPMAGRVVSQLLKGTEWGELDVLVIDMPPGTGDVQLTLCQDLELSGAVTVSTPSKLAATDAIKGIEMFTSLGVPTLAMVENMSYFDCEGGQRHYPFGKSIVESANLLRQTDSDLSESKIFQFPISNRTNEANDNGIPLCLSRPEDAKVELDAFHNLACEVSKELLLLQHGRSSDISDNSSVRLGGESFDVASLHLSVDNSKQSFVVRLFSDAGATEVEISGAKLREWHPKLGEAMELESLEEESDPSNDMVTHTSGTGCGSHAHSHGVTAPKLFPCRIEKKGRYGYSVEWADQATIIYSMYSLARAAGGVPEKSP